MFGDKLKTTACELANEFSKSPKLLEGMYSAQDPKDKISLLVIEALSLRGRTHTALKSIIKHVSGLVRFYLEARKETKCELTGEHSVVLLHDYLASLAERAERPRQPRNTR